MKYPCLVPKRLCKTPLLDYPKISHNRTCPRRNSIKKVTIHHMAGNLSVETCGNVFAPSSAKGSSNYAIGTDGRVGMYVEEKDRAWTSSSPANDNQSITIEVANDEIGGNWHVSDRALAKLIELCVDICKRNGIPRLTYTGDATGNLTRHNMFAKTTCPWPYLQSKFPYIADEVNKRLGTSVSPSPTTPISNIPKPTNAPISEAELRIEGIKKFQSWLNSDYAMGLVVDGKDGPKTRGAAIACMQMQLGVKVDGIWGNKSKAACVTLRKGDSGHCVYILQGLLYCNGYVYSGFDGKFGRKTESEVKSYQGAKKLAKDGIAGKDTFTSLLVG